MGGEERKRQEGMEGIKGEGKREERDKLGEGRKRKGNEAPN